MCLALGFFFSYENRGNMTEDSKGTKKIATYWRVWMKVEGTKGKAMITLKLS
jgi:hypothetical protein